jgi:hypothetical protein
MSWLFSQVLVEEYLGDISSDGEQSVQSNGSHTQQAYCAPDKMTAFSRLSRFGMTYKPLTESRGEELLTLYLAGFHAKTSPQPEKEKELTENGQECGEKWHASFTKYDPDSSSWKTHQCSLLGDLDEFSETWPRWGLMRSGECWEQRMLEQTIRGTESGFWPTPSANKNTESGELVNKDGTPWDGMSKPHSKKTGKPVQTALADAIKKRMLPTPTASMMPCEGTVRIMRKVWESGEMSLEEASAIAGRDVRKAQGKVKAWPTPNARDWKDTGTKESLQKQVDNGHQMTLGRAAGGALNPTWVEWLMGWPLGWTDLKPLETDKFQKWLDAHGNS